MIGKKRKRILSSVVIPVSGIMLLSVLLALLVIVSSSFSAFAQEQDDPYFEDLVLAVNVGSERLSPGIFAVQQKGRYYLPVATLSEILNFQVSIDKERRSIEGWAISKDRSFALNSEQGMARYRDRQTTLASEAFLDADIADAHDVYVLLEVLNEIWPLQFKVNLSALVLEIIPDDVLPFQQALNRKKRQEKLAKKREAEKYQKEEIFPFIAQPYKLFGKPVIDLQTQVGFDGQTDEAEYRMNVAGVQDLGYASADYSLALGQKGGVFDKPRNFRLRFRRQNIHEGALPFGLEDAQWGDIRLTNRDLIASGLSGRGAIFSTQENFRSGEFGIITVDGVASAGWEVELHINNELIDFGVVDERGEYRFEDVSISYGNNRVRIILYGPQGQIEERVENYFYQSSMAKKGQNIFSGGVVDAQRDLIPIEERITGRTKGLAANFYGARGITEKLTAYGSINRLRDDDTGNKKVTRQYATVGAVGSFGTTLAQGEVYKEIGGGTAVDVKTLSDFFGFKINTRAALYSSFESPDAGNGSIAKTAETDVTVRRIFSTFLGSLGLEVGADYLKRKNGTRTRGYTTRQSLGISGARITHQTRTSLTNGSHSTTNGRLSSTARMKDWRFRNSLNYTVFPDTDITSTDFELRHGNINDFSTAFRLQRNFTNQELIAGVQITQDFEKFLGSVDADWSSKFGASLMLRASTSLGPYASDGGYIMSSDSMRSAGPISSKIYLDKDYDGTFSEGDEPVPDTKITIGRRITRAETDEDGHLLEVNSGIAGKTKITVARESIDDPYLVPSIPGYSVYPRPGVIHALEFPLIETGAIDGTIKWSADGKPLAGLALQLMNAEGDIIQGTQTAIDGYYTFERVPPDNYTIRADPKSGLSIPFKSIDLTSDNLFQFGTDIKVVDLSVPQNNNLDIEVGKDAALSVKNILSVAKGFKDKKDAKQKPKPITQKDIQSRTQNQIQNQTQDQTQSHNIEPSAGLTSVNAVRIGTHPGKIRVVLDIAAPLNYSISHDPVGKSVFVDMPSATWAAAANWQNASQGILNNYRTETLPAGGVRLIFGVGDNIKIGASGLLKAYAGKKDRLYIDIEKK